MINYIIMIVKKVIKKSALILSFSTVFFLCFSACKKSTTELPASGSDITLGRLQVSLVHLFESDTLVLNNDTYVTSNNDTLSISLFKYYLTNFKIKNTNGTWINLPETYFLIDESESGTKDLLLDNIPAGNYTELSCIIGVDSISNVSGAQDGVLDPIYGMFWDWNSGYLFLKLEGNSNQSPFGDIVYHLGGYKKPTNCIRWKNLPFNGTAVSISKQLNPKVFINVNVAEMFRNPVTINLSQTHHVTGGNDLMTLVDNYVDMWQVASVIQ